MCGRYSITTPVEGLRQVFLFEELPNLAPRYNVAPSQDVPAVRLEDDGKRHLRMLRWGLIPSWAKDRKIGYKTINARAETVAEKPAFRGAFRQRRCLILADGFYEWQVPAVAGDGAEPAGKSAKPAKQPYRIVMADRSPFAFAGLWESWRDPEAGETLASCSIVVTDANESLRAIHHRMPVILPPRSHAAWLDPRSGRETLTALLKPYGDSAMAAYPVSPRVNKPANDDAACIEPLADAPIEQPPAQASLL